MKHFLSTFSFGLIVCAIGGHQLLYLYDTRMLIWKVVCALVREVIHSKFQTESMPHPDVTLSHS